MVLFITRHSLTHTNTHTHTKSCTVCSPNPETHTPTNPNGFTCVGPCCAPVQALLSMGVSPDYRDRCGLTPLYHALLTGGDTSCCETLLYYRAKLGVRDENGWEESHQVSVCLFTVLSIYYWDFVTFFIFCLSSFMGFPIIFLYLSTVCQVLFLLYCILCPVYSTACPSLVSPSSVPPPSPLSLSLSLFLSVCLSLSLSP